MGTLDRLRRSAPPDATATLLTALFAVPALDAAAISPALLARVPLPRLTAMLAALTDRHGALRAVRPREGLYLLEFTDGEELVHAELDPEGRLASLVSGPGALLARAARRATPDDAPVPRPAPAPIAPGDHPEGAAPVAPEPRSAPGGQVEAATGRVTAYAAEASGHPSRGTGPVGAATSGVPSGPGRGSRADGAPAGTAAPAAPTDSVGAGAAASPSPLGEPTDGATAGGAEDADPSSATAGSAGPPARRLHLHHAQHPQAGSSAPVDADGADRPSAGAGSGVVSQPPGSWVASNSRRTPGPSVGSDGLRNGSEPDAPPPAQSDDSQAPGVRTTGRPLGSDNLQNRSKPDAPPPAQSENNQAPGIRTTGTPLGSDNLQNRSKPDAPPPAQSGGGRAPGKRARVRSPKPWGQREGRGDGGGRGAPEGGRVSRAGVVIGLQRALGAYCAATAVELVLPWLAGTGPGWALLVAQTPAFAWYVLRTAPTHAVPPWFRWLALAPAAGGLFAGLRAWQLPWAARPGVLEVVFAVGVFGLAAWAWRRSRPVRPAPVSHPLVLRFPLRGGTFAFTEAGGPAVNRYADESLIPGGDRSRRYAADIVQLGDGPQWRGRRALGLSPTANNRYAVFGHPVHSPVDGVVLAVLDGLPDHPPRYLSAAHPDGNHVVIDTGRGQVVLAWLRRDSIRVQRGKHVTAGQLVGAVGNSGAGTEPGLHLRAETGVGLGLPFRFAELKGVPLRGRRLTVPE